MSRLLAMAAASVTCGAVLAQSELPFAANDAQAALVDRIAHLRAEGGPTPAGSIEPLRALALLHQEDGNDALALALLEEARYVTRVHQGLSSADEALLLRQQIRSAEALGDHERVWNLEQDMVTIARQHHDDIRMAPIFRDLAEDRSDALARYRAGELPPEIYLGCYYTPLPRRYDDTRGQRRPPVGADSGCRSGQSSTVYAQLRHEIMMYYADAIEVIVKDGDYASQELRDLERAAIRASPAFAGSLCRSGTLDELLANKLVGSCLEPVIRISDRAIGNVGGLASLLRLAAYEIRSGAPATDRANAIAELADWHTLFAHTDKRSFGAIDERALELYERAYLELEKGGDPGPGTARIFSPDLPVVLPTSESNPLATVESSRFIDVAFVVTKYGRGQRIQILDTGKNATRAEQRDLIRLIEGVSFRPRVVDGELADAARVTLRYYLGS